MPISKKELRFKFVIINLQLYEFAKKKLITCICNSNTIIFAIK